eukprot:4177105-Pyramimonas_sp.AAC.1
MAAASEAKKQDVQDALVEVGNASKSAAVEQIALMAHIQRNHAMMKGIVHRLKVMIGATSEVVSPLGEQGGQFAEEARVKREAADGAAVPAERHIAQTVKAWTECQKDARTGQEYFDYQSTVSNAAKLFAVTSCDVSANLKR